MGKKRVMTPAKDVDLSSIKYEREIVQGNFILLLLLQLSWVFSFYYWHLFFAAPHLTGFVFRLFVRIIEAPVIGPIIMNILKKENKMDEVRVLLLKLVTTVMYSLF